MGKTIQSAERNLVLKVIQFFDNEKKHGSFIVPVEQSIKRACLATGLSKRSIMNIKREAKEMLKSAEAMREANLQTQESNQHPQPSTSGPLTFDSIKLPTPGKKRKKYKKKIDLDHLDLCAIRNLLESFYTKRKEVPTLKNILKIAREELNFPGQKDALRNILSETLGYRFKKCKGWLPKT